MAACPRCSDCVGMTHHWIPNASEARPGGWYDCRHCGTKGQECAVCSGEGCDKCNHEGVFSMVIPTDPPETNWGDDAWCDDPRTKTLLTDNEQLRAALDQRLGHCKRHGTFFDENDPCWQCVNEQIKKCQSTNQCDLS
jgi:hypothetical protein